MTGRLRLEWWAIQWFAMAGLLTVMTFVVQRLAFAVPASDVRVVLDFNSAYTQPGWRQASFLAVCAVAVLWSWRRRAGGE